MSMFKAGSRFVQGIFNASAEYAEAFEETGKAAKAAAHGLHMETKLEAEINLKEIKAKAESNNINLPTFIKPSS